MQIKSLRVKSYRSWRVDDTTVSRFNTYETQRQAV